MGDIADFKELIGKTLTGIQNRHNAIILETDQGPWRAYQAGQAYIEGRIENVIGSQIVDAGEEMQSGSLTVYNLTTAQGALIIRSRRNPEADIKSL